MQASALSCESAPRASARRLAGTPAFLLLASVIVSFLAGSSAPTPLYSVYRAEWGFSPIMMTVIFGIYAIAVLVSLLFAGRLSDHLGRRPVAIAAIGGQILAMFLLGTANGLAQLLAARVVQGLAAGAAVAAVGAGMIDLDKNRGATANAVAPALGTATGGLLAGFTVQYLPAPTHLIYAVLAVVFLMQGVGVYLMRETIAPRTGALASLKPQFHLPQAVREPLLLALPVLVAAWGLASFYGALAPTLVRALTGSTSPMTGGLALFALAASAGAAVLILQQREARAVMIFGASALAVGAAALVWTLPRHSLSLFFLATVVAGAGFGTGFQGAMRTIVPLAAPHERAGVVSIVFIVSYLALGVPAVLAGARLAQHGDILATAQEFGTTVMILALMAVLATVMRAVTRPRSA